MSQSPESHVNGLFDVVPELEEEPELELEPELDPELDPELELELDELPLEDPESDGCPPGDEPPPHAEMHVSNETAKQILRVYRKCIYRLH